MYANLLKNGFSTLQAISAYGDGVCSLCSKPVKVSKIPDDGDGNCFRLVCCGNRICLECSRYLHGEGSDSESHESKPCDSCPVCKRLLPTSEDKMRSIVDEHISKLTPWAFYVYGQWWEKLNLDISYPGGLKPESTVVGSKNTRASKALKLYEKGASLRDVGCMYHLGVSYSRDDFWLVKQDLKRSLLYLCKAAKLGHLDAQFRAAWCYETGSGIPRCPPTALKLFKQSADGGNPEAMWTLYYILHCKSTSAAHGVEWDPFKCLDYLMMAARLGNSTALLHLSSFSHSEDRPTEKLLYMRAAYSKFVKEGADVALLKKDLIDTEAFVQQGHCANCHLQASDNMKLKECTQCFTVCYCGRACHASHWKHIHRDECKQVYDMDCLPHNETAETVLESDGREFLSQEPLEWIYSRHPVGWLH